MVFVSSARVEINHVHNAVGFLKQVKGALILLSLDELVGRVIEFGHYNRNFVFTDSELFVIVTVESIILVVADCGLTIRCLSVFQVASGPSAFPCLLGPTAVPGASWILRVSRTVTSVDKRLELVLTRLAELPLVRYLYFS